MTVPWRIESDSIFLNVASLDYRRHALKEMGATYVGSSQEWKLPAARMYARWLAELSLTDDRLVDALAPAGGPITREPRLYAYQREAAGRLAASRHGAMLVMPPGKGKTPTAIVAADEYAPDDTIVVVTLPTLVDNWRREIETWARRDDERWTDLVYVVREKITDNEVVKMFNVKWLIVSWDRVVSDPTLWATTNKWPLWIIDENVLAKSRVAHRKLVFSGGNVKKAGKITKHYPGLQRSVERFWMLSASPTTRHADDLWGSLSILWPRAFRSYWRFAERYCTVEVTPWARKVTGDRMGTDPVGDNDDVIIVSTPDIDLPEYIFEPRTDVELLPRQRAAFDRMTHEFIAELGSGRQVVANNEIGKLVRLQQIVSYWDGESAKADAVLEIVARSDPPYLIWTHWVEGAQFLHDQLFTSGFTGHYINGQTRERDTKIEAYKEGNLDYLVMSLGVGKFGHTLTNTQTEIRVDKTFSADDYFQSLHRVRRIGLTHRPRLFTLHASGTTDDLVNMNQEGKMQSISKITRSELAALLKGLGK